MWRSAGRLYGPPPVLVVGLVLQRQSREAVSERLEQSGARKVRVAQCICWGVLPAGQK